LIAAPNILYLVNPRVCDTRAGIIKTISTVGFVSGIYVVAVTLLIMTVMSIERWVHIVPWLLHLYHVVPYPYSPCGFRHIGLHKA